MPTPDPTTYTYHPTHSPSYVCNSDPVNCACPNLWGSDYRGTINTTTSGKACVRWDMNNWYLTLGENHITQDHPNAGIEGNFCRNPNNDPNGPWCFTGLSVYEYLGYWEREYCDVPMCDASPTSSPSVSTIPTSSSMPTTSTLPSLGPTLTSSPTKLQSISTSPSISPSHFPIYTYTDTYTYRPTHSPSYVCNSDPVNCACPNLRGSDYRGTINTTTSGKACVRWDDPNLNRYLYVEYGENLTQDYPDNGLEGNFCRNPDYFVDRPWCYTEVTVFSWGGSWNSDYCDVPVCDASPTSSPSIPTIPTSSSRPTPSMSSSLDPTSTSLPTKRASSSPSFAPSFSSSPTNTCNVADKSTCGCEDVDQSDYRGTISTTEDGTECERWDADWMFFSEDFVERAGLDENYCRDPFDYDFVSVSKDRRPGCYTSNKIFDEDGSPKFSYCVVPKCKPCSCMPICGRPNLSECGCPSALQADECCNQDEGQVKYRQCRCGYLKEACRVNIENNSTDFCDDAAIECAFCSTYGHNCKCAMYEQICFEFPSSSTCELAASSCCAPYSDSGYRVSETCYCDFYSSVRTVIGYESEHETGNCSVARQEIFDPIDNEKRYLKWMYSANGGDDWNDNTGWSDDGVTPHCQWFGITCNEDGLVIEINLRNNNLTGSVDDVFDYLLGAFKEMKVLDLAENKLTGTIPFEYIPTFLKLEHIDISNNALTGHADMTFPSFTSYVNFSHNSFTGITYKRVNPAYESLKVVDLSYNILSQDALSIFYNIPPNIQELVLSKNSIAGELPDQLPLQKLIRFDISDNDIGGNLPNFPGTASLIREIDLSNQKRSYGGGLTGTIWTDIFKLVDLSVLNLADNNLTGEIPVSIGNLAKLKVLNLSSNSLDKQIPTELGRLKDVLKILDLSYNKLSGTIPSSIGDFDGESSLQLRNNTLMYPAPLMLCFIDGFDLSNDFLFCPTERNALNEFYISAKGSEWTVSINWMDPRIGHCDWYGITCNDENRTIRLELQNNGLSGTLTPAIACLSALEDLDLNNNDIKGLIPNEIGSLSNLKHLRLSYNQFTGNGINFGSLEDLKLIHLHGNRLSGSIPAFSWEIQDPSSYVSDCGNPSDFRPSLVCDGCTMCCNNEAYCNPPGETSIQQAGFADYKQSTIAFIGIIVVASCALVLALLAYDNYKNHDPSTLYQSIVDDTYKDYASDKLCSDSVYHFFLGKSVCGWLIVLSTIAVQFWLLFIFVKASEKNLSDDKVDVVYTWKCTRDKEICVNTKDLDWEGWLACAVVMLAHLLVDVINGVKMIMLSAKEKQGRLAMIRLFAGGTLLTTITSFTIYVSTIYNFAIATSEYLRHDNVLQTTTFFAERLFPPLDSILMARV
ncbi:hypothetical protein ACHAXA_009041 [Cyclostephanos tholiformis]|uniref:Kringle domain-containing protein n=1 Tax=Cyclostephanos tholiformis TaxID=382380 RepID=A0ABD3RY35_9STRA